MWMSSLFAGGFFFFPVFVFCCAFVFVVRLSFHFPHFSSVFPFLVRFVCFLGLGSSFSSNYFMVIPC